MPHIDDRRGVSTFIAVLLLMVLAVSAGAVIYSYTMGYLGNLGGVGDSGSFGRMSLDSAVYTDEGLTAYIRNLGGGTIVLDRAYVDSTLAEGAGYSFEVNGPGTDDDVITEGETGTVTINIPGGFEAGRNYEFKLVDTGNTQLTFTLRAMTTVAETGDDWLGGWDKRVKMTVDHNDVDGGLTDFPLLIYLSSSSGRGNDDVSFVFDELQSDGNRRKIAATTGDGTTQCYVEIEEWDHSNEKAWLWVKVPSIISSADTELYLYYDRDHADNTDYVGDSGSTTAENVWDNNFVGLWHLHETSGTHYDSTSSGHDGTPQGGVVQNVIGKVNGADDFDGTDDDLEITDFGGYAENWDTSVTGISISAWTKLDSLHPPTTLWYEKASTIVLMGDPDGYTEWLPTWQLWACHVYAHTFTFGSDEDLKVEATFTPTMGVWYHVVGTYDPSTGNISLYVDGNLENAVPYTCTGSETTGDSPIWIGRGGYDDGEPSRWLDGTLDEVRISSTARSAAWIKASYESENDDLFEFGSEEIA